MHVLHSTVMFCDIRNVVILRLEETVPLVHPW